MGPLSSEDDPIYLRLKQYCLFALSNRLGYTEGEMIIQVVNRDVLWSDIGNHVVTSDED